MENSKILVVDDDPVVFEIIRVLGQGHGYEVIGAGTGEGGLVEAAEQKPDIIVLDLRLPEMDGIEVCRRLRHDERTRHIPVLMLTSETDKDLVLSGFESGVDDYVRKPFEPEELLARVRAILMRIRGTSPAEGVLHDHLSTALELHEKGRLEDAESHYRKAVEQDPGNLMAYNNLAIICENQGRIDEAIELLRAAMERCRGDDGYRETLDRNLVRVKRKKSGKK